MNGYTLSRNWFDWAFENPDLNTPSHTALYLWIVEKWNRCGQKEKISITTSECLEALGMSSRNTFSKVFKDLVDWKFIKIISDSQNQYTSKVISLAQKTSKQDASTKQALDKALIQQDSKQDASTDTINKQDNKETKKPKKETRDISELTLPFDSLNFLNAWNEFLEYRDVKGKKVSYDACKKIFKDLAKEDENIAIAMLEKTIKNDWQGVFPLNEAEKKQIKKTVAGFGLQSSIFEGLRFFYKNVPSEIYMDRDKCIAIPDSVFGYNKRVINYPEYTKFRNFLTQNGIDLDNLPAITFEPELFTKKEPIEILKLWIGKN